MAKSFSRITLYARQYRANREVNDTLNIIAQFLKTQAVSLFAEHDTAQVFTRLNLPTIKLEQLGDEKDLIIVVGGDGSLLTAAKTASLLNVPILGVNRGQLGFLTDILPDSCEQQIDDVLDGKYKEESRFLLNARLDDGKDVYADNLALNDVVLMPGSGPHMLEFEIIIDQQPVCVQKADGLIVATPTGSTAYSLSGGGPILHPQLDAIVLLPMFPHTLSSRPIVIDADAEINIHIRKHNVSVPRLNCDGRACADAVPGSKITINKQQQMLRLLHPLDYNYYETLRSKLGWETKHP